MDNEDEDDDQERLISVNTSFNEGCAYCSKVEGIKIPFCRVCAPTRDGIQLDATFVHRVCAEKHMTKDRKFQCPTCASMMVMAYTGAVHEDYAVRNMRETFAHCWPSAERSYAFNFFAVKHTLLAVVAMAFMITFIVLAVHASPEREDSTDSGSELSVSWPLRLSQIVITLSFALFLLSWFISSSSSLMYVILYGSVRNAKRQLIAEIALYICMAAVSLTSAVAWRTLLSADVLFGIWVVFVALIILAIVIIAVIDKMKTYAMLALLGWTVQVVNDDQV